jgi:hypothetical protein
LYFGVTFSAKPELLLEGCERFPPEGVLCGDASTPKGCGRLARGKREARNPWDPYKTYAEP